MEQLPCKAFHHYLSHQCAGITASPTDYGLSQINVTEQVAKILFSSGWQLWPLAH